MSEHKSNKQTGFSLPNKKIQQKIQDHIKQIIRKNSSVLSSKTSHKPEEIPQKIIQKNKQTHKYLYKKTLINTKFQWLNKYLEKSEVSSLSMNIKSNKAKLNHEFPSSRNTSLDWKKKKRSKTEGFDCIEEEQNGKCSEKINSFENKDQQIFRQRSLNRKILSQNHFRLKKQKKTKNSSNVSATNDEHLKKMLIDEKRINNFNCEFLLKVSRSSNNLQDKQNLHQDLIQKKVLKVFIEQNTPVKQFLQCTSRLKTSNLMIKYKSGYIKNKKKLHIYQSREGKYQKSELLKLKKQYQEQINVQPWNLGNQQRQQNQQNDFILNNHS